MLIGLGKKLTLEALVIGGVSCLSLMAAGNRQVIGQVVTSSGASLGGVVIPDESTLTAGDLLTTAKGGSALVKFSPTTQVTVSEETSVQFRRAAGHILAQLSSGTGTMVSDGLGKDFLIVETPKCKIEPAEQGKAIYLVAVLPDQSTLVAARHGKVSVTESSSGRSYLLSEGEYAAIATPSASVPGQEKEESKQEPSKPAGQAPAKPPEEHKHTGTAIALVLGSVGAAAAIALAVSSGGRAPVSPSQP